MNDDNYQFNWVSSDGGPLILMEQKYLANWEGCNESSSGRVVKANFRWGLDAATDYDRACDVEDYLGLIDVGEGKALVLGGDELPTTWLPKSQEGILIRWFYGNSEPEIIEIAESLSDKTGKNENFTFTVEDLELNLFAATENGDDKRYSRLRFNLLNGIYKIFTIEHKDEQNSMICHRFRKIV